MPLPNKVLSNNDAADKSVILGREPNRRQRHHDLQRELESPSLQENLQNVQIDALKRQNPVYLETLLLLP